MTPNDVDPRMYTTVLREMIRHENDVTNHRIMWLLLGQGLIANAYVGSPSGVRSISTALAGVGVLLTLSTYFILYKSYQARGYLEFLGRAAKSGVLTEGLLPMMGWPSRRVKDWRAKVWVTPWLAKGSDLMEPYLCLPAILLLAWTMLLARPYLPADRSWVLPVCGVSTVAFLILLSMAWVRVQQRDEVETLPSPLP